MNRAEVGRRFITAIVWLSVADLLFLGLRILLTGTARYWFVPENLALAWASLFFAWNLNKNLTTKRWLSWQNIVLTILWLVFLPNTWYVLTDFIHVFPNGEINQLYDIVMIGLLVFCGFILGLASLFLVHKQLVKRLSSSTSYLLVELVLLLASFAIYLGRDLRWNSWDVITNPSGVIVNVSDRIIDPFGSARAFNITILFFLMLSIIYAAVWWVLRPMPRKS